MPKDRMLIKREVTTYAEVLLNAVKETGDVLEAAAQLKEVQEVVLTHPNLREESLTQEARATVIDEVFKGFSPAVLKVLEVMVERREIALLHRVVEEFEALAEDELNVIILDVTTVVELDDALRQTIKSKYAAQFGKDVMLREHVNPSIIGGIVLSARGKRIDASVSAQLEKVRSALSSVKTGGER